jgi:hypothetical protein
MPMPKMKSVTPGPVLHSMSEQFFYAKLKLLPKRGVVTVSASNAQEVGLELPRKLIEDWKRENPERELTERESLRPP